MDKLSFLTSIYFNEQQYLSNKAAALNVQNYDGNSAWTADSVSAAFSAAGISALEHYSTYGAYETNATGKLGINPGSFFDQDSYYNDKAQQLSTLGAVMSKADVANVFKEMGTNPLAHYSSYGYMEWVFPTLANIQSMPFTNPMSPDHPSNDYRIDALAYTVDWTSSNALGAKQGNVLYYTYPTDPRGQIHSPEVDPLLNVMPFISTQKEGADAALNMLAKVTGIRFEYTDNSDQANILLFSAKAPDFNEDIMAYSQWLSDRQNVVVLNTTDFPELTDLRFGTTQEQFMTVLHELGHSLGLKHPFDKDDGPVILPEGEDNYAYTLMSYNKPSSEPGDEYAWYYESRGDTFLSPYDIAALQWIYGTDGLNGSEGLIYVGA